MSAGTVPRLSLKSLVWKARHGLLLLLAIVAVRQSAPNLNRVRDSLLPSFVYFKDCIQPYLMAKAVLDGTSPYTPLPQLARRWLPQADPADHPTPYPPFVALMSLPLAAVSYEDAAILWLFGEALCLLTAVLLLLRSMGHSWNPPSVAAIVALVFLWNPVIEELTQGQFMSGVLLLLLGAWLALRDQRQALGGALLGCSIAIKLMGWPILLFLLLRRNWSAARAAIAVILAAHLLAVLALGGSVVANYYLEVGSLNARLWRPAQGNYSSWAWGIRLFEGAGFGYELSPWHRAPLAASLATAAIPALIFGAGLRFSMRARTFDTAFGLLVGVSLLVSPIFWNFYLLLAVIPGAVLARRLKELAFPAEATLLALLSWLLMSLRPGFCEHLALSFAVPSGPTLRRVVPFFPGLFLLVPVAGLAGVLWLLWRTDQARPRASDEVLRRPTSLSA